MAIETCLFYLSSVGFYFRKNKIIILQRRVDFPQTVFIIITSILSITINVLLVTHLLFCYMILISILVISECKKQEILSSSCHVEKNNQSRVRSWISNFRAARQPATPSLVLGSVVSVALLCCCCITPSSSHIKVTTTTLESMSFGLRLGTSLRRRGSQNLRFIIGDGCNYIGCKKGVHTVVFIRHGER